MIKHIIFDCYGTLIDTGESSINAVQKILHNVHSHEDPTIFYSDWKAKKRQMMRFSDFKSEKELFRLSLAETFEKYGIIADASIEVLPMIDALFAKRICFPDVKSTLQALLVKGYDIAVGSTADTDCLLDCLHKNDLHFDFIFTSEDVSAYKPNPLFYKTILLRTGWKADECLFVGDSYVDDVCGPQNVGMKAVLLDRKMKHSLENFLQKPDYVISSIEGVCSIPLLYQ